MKKKGKEEGRREREERREEDRMEGGREGRKKRKKKSWGVQLSAKIEFNPQYWPPKKGRKRKETKSPAHLDTEVKN